MLERGATEYLKWMAMHPPASDTVLPPDFAIEWGDPRELAHVDLCRGFDRLAQTRVSALQCLPMTRNA